MPIQYLFLLTCIDPELMLVRRFKGKILLMSLLTCRVLILEISYNLEYCISEILILQTF